MPTRPLPEEGWCWDFQGPAQPEPRSAWRGAWPHGCQGVPAELRDKVRVQNEGTGPRQGTTRQCPLGWSSRCPLGGVQLGQTWAGPQESTLAPGSSELWGLGRARPDRRAAGAQSRLRWPELDGAPAPRTSECGEPGASDTEPPRRPFPALGGIGGSADRPKGPPRPAEQQMSPGAVTPDLASRLLPLHLLPAWAEPGGALGPCRGHWPEGPP